MVRKISWREMFEQYDELKKMSHEERVERLGEEWTYIFEGLSNPFEKEEDHE